MIVIKGENFEMVQSSGPFFDLSVLTKINKGTEKEREEMKLIAYGLPFDACLKEIVQYYIDTSKTYTVAEYIKVYAQAVDIVKDLITNVDKPKRTTISKVEDDDN